MNAGVSLKPSDATQGGGFFDDVDAVITSCRFRAWDYNGKIAAPILGLAVTFKALGDDQETEQVYSAGDMKHFVPSPDGKEAVAIGNKTGLNDQTNAIFFLSEFVNAGFPEDKIGSDISVFEGCQVHLNQVPAPKRPGQSGLDANGKPKTVLVVKKILSLPWDKAAGAVGGKTKGAKAAQANTAAAAPAAAPVASGDVLAKSIEHVLNVVMAKGGSIAKASLGQEVFKLVGNDPDRMAIVQTSFKDEFLNGSMGAVPWQFDGTTVSMG